MIRTSFCAMLLLSGCVPSAGVLVPDQLPAQHGAAFGRVRVWKGEDEVTGSCYVAFSTLEDQDISRVSLDDTGWVFIALPEGHRRMHSVSCVVWNGLNYFPHEFDFEISRKSGSTYFGDLQFHLPDEDTAHFFAAVADAIPTIPVASVTGAIASSAGSLTARGLEYSLRDGKNTIVVKDDVDRATREYRQRYGHKPSVFASIVGKPAAATKPPALRRGDMLYTEAKLPGVDLTWLALVRRDEQRLAMRLRRNSRDTAFEGCAEAAIAVDGTERRFPLRYNAKRGTLIVTETVQVEIDRATLVAIGAAKSVTLKVCSLQRELTSGATEAAQILSAANDAAVAKLPPVPAPEPSPEASPQLATDPPPPESPGIQ